MKEFIKKLIGKLEELKTFKLDLADAMSEQMKRGRLDNYISKEEVIKIANELAEEYNQTIDVAELVEEFGQEKVRSNDGWNLLTDDEDSYPKPFEYVLVQDDIGDENVACCYPDYDWYISNGEDSLKLIGNIVAWQPLHAPYQPKGEYIDETMA